MPAECVVGRRLGFYYELVATLLMPAFSFGVIMLMALLLYGCELRQGRRESRRQLEVQARAELLSPSFGQLMSRDSGASSGRLPAELQAKKVERRHRHFREDSLLVMLNRPQVWTLNIWAWLLLYPSVTRKALQTFDCIELLGESYLRADPATDCSGADWWFMAVLAAVGVFVTCILAPLALVRQTSPNPTLTLTPTLTPTLTLTLTLTLTRAGGSTCASCVT